MFDVYSGQDAEKFHVKFRLLLSLSENKLRLLRFRIEFQFQLLKKNGMAKLTTDIGSATQQAVANQQLNAFAFTLLNSIPLVNSLEECQRLPGRTLVRQPLLALLLPCAE